MVTDRVQWEGGTGMVTDRVQWEGEDRDGDRQGTVRGGGQG